MYRHPFDAISFFFGLVFTAGAVSSLLVDETWPFGRGRLWPILLIAGGLALLIASLRPNRDRRPEPVAATAVVAVPDPLLGAAHREVAEYVGDVAPVTEPEAAAAVAADPDPATPDDRAEPVGSAGDESPDEESPLAP